MNRKTFKVKIEQELEISFDMDKYNSEMVHNVGDYWGFDEEVFFEELSEFIACKYIRDGYFNYEAEGLVVDGHKGEVEEGIWISVNEKE